MPELPEVETVKNGISPYALGQKIINVIVRNRHMRFPIPDGLEAQATGAVIEEITRRSKYLLLKTGRGTIIIHLGMSGVILITDAATTLKKHDHVDIILANRKILRLNDPRRFGCVLWETGDPLQHRLLVKLAPEPLSRGFTKNYLYETLKGRKSNIKAALMNSHLVVGVGNIYASESLFRAKISPYRLTDSLSLDECACLVSEIKKVLLKSIKAGGTTLKDFAQVDGKPGYFAQSLEVYGRTDKQCKICGTAIKSARIANRATYYCPSCQI